MAESTWDLPSVVAERPPPLRLSTVFHWVLGEWAVAGHPHESCGLLIGRVGAGGSRVTRITRARNLAMGRLADRYVLDPEDFLAADRAARRDGLEIVGIWHTHPDHPARPSTTDLDAAWEGYTYLILSVRAEGVGEITAWQLVDGRFVEQSVEEVAA